MMNLEERNAYTKEHLCELKRIRNIYAGSLHRRFPTVPLCDLQGYGWLGMIYALDRVDPDSPTFEPYIRRYVYLFMLTGGMEMVGIHRDRSRCPTETLSIEFYDPHDLVQVMDGVQDVDLRSYGDYESILNRQEIEHLLNVVEGSMEAQVLLGLLRHESMSEISRRLGVTSKRVRKSIETLIKVSRRERSFVLLDTVCQADFGACVAEVG